MVSLSELPDHVVSKIAGYLQTKDLITCTAVSKSWRVKLNQNTIWTRRLQFPKHYYNIQERYKGMILCVPYFTTLEPLCTARECYIRDQCLRWNCRSGLFTVDGFHIKGGGEINQIIDVIDQRGNYWLFLNSSKAVEVWNITNKPFLQSLVFKKQSDVNDLMYIRGKKVVLVYYNQVQVFLFEEPIYDLIFHSWFMFEDQSSSNTLEDLKTPQLLQPDLIKHFVHNDIFIGYTGITLINSLHNANMHIWNLESGNKLSTTRAVHIEVLLHLQNSIPSAVLRFQIYKGNFSDVLVSLLCQTIGDKFSTLMIFNVQQLTFTEFKKCFPQSDIILCTITDNRCILVLCMMMSGNYIITLVESNEREIDLKCLSSLNICNTKSKIFLENSTLYVQNCNKVYSIKEKYLRLAITKILQDDHLVTESMAVVNHFILAKDINIPVKMWDIDEKKLIKELPDFTKEINLGEVLSLKDVHFPPKVICANTKHTSVLILNFW